MDSILDRSQSVPPSGSSLDPAIDRPASSQGRLSQLIAGKSSRSRVSSISTDGGKAEMTGTVDHSGVDGYGSRGTKGGRAASVALLQADPRYKRYAQTIERALTTFESVAEWADFISFLSRLHKALLSASPTYPEIPHKLQIAKRLAQGLNPALPSGVHQRTLEVYREIFRILGEDGLRRDLSTWSSGFFPFFQYAATAVRPTVLDIYETHYLPLGRSLRPASKALALALLPGLEEETGDHFDRVLKLVDKVSESVEDAHFLQCVFVVIITNPGSRTSAVNYLTRRLPPRLKGYLKPVNPTSTNTDLKTTTSDRPRLGEVIGPDGGLFVRALSAGLEDDSVLVRRGTLDLLNACLPLPVLISFADFDPADRKILIKAACGIVLRRDLSLSKRLYGWLLGDEEESERQIDRFRQTGLMLVKDALQEEMLNISTNTLDSARPFRIFVSLLDRWEVGYPLSIALVYNSLTIAMRVDQDETAEESVKENARMAARAVYEGVEPYVFWSLVYNKLGKSGEDGSETRHALGLSVWVLNTFRIQDEEITRIHLPKILQLLIAEHIRLSAAAPEVLAATLRAIVKALPWASMTASKPDGQDESTTSQYNAAQSAAIEYYTAESLYRPPEMKRTRAPPGQSLIQGIVSNWTPQQITTVPLAEQCGLLSDVTDAGQRVLGGLIVEWQPDDFLPRMNSDIAMIDSFRETSAFAKLVLRLGSASWLRPTLKLRSANIAPKIVDSLFHFMQSQHLYHHKEAAALLWRVADASSPALLRQTVMRSLVRDGAGADSVQAFSRLWTFTEDPMKQEEAFHLPLFYILDGLHSDDVVLKRLAQGWMRCDLGLYIRMLDVVTLRLSMSIPATKRTTIDLADQLIEFDTFRAHGDIKQVAYVLSKMTDILTHGGQLLATHLATSAVPVRARELLAVDISNREFTYRDIISKIAIKVMYLWDRTSSPDTSKSEPPLHLAAVSLLESLISSGDWSAADLASIENATLPRLWICVHCGDLDLQTSILTVLQTLITKQQSSQEIPSSSLLGSPMRSHARTRSSVSIKTDKVDSGQTQADNAFLLQTILAGISVASNRSILADWLEFILSISTGFSSNLLPILYPISDALCQQIRMRLRDMEGPTIPASSTVTGGEGEIPLLLQAAELIVRSIIPNDASGDIPRNGNALSEPAGLFGYVSTVLTGEGSTVRVMRDAPLVGAVQTMRGVISAAIETFNIFYAMQDEEAAFGQELVSASQACLLRLYSWKPTEALGAIVDSAVDVDRLRLNPKALPLILDSLTPSSHKLVSLLCDMISPLFSDAERTGTVNDMSRPTKVIAVLDAYLAGVEAPVAIDVLPAAMSLVRTANVSTATINKKRYLLPLLRLYFTLMRKIAQTSAFNDRRLKKDALDSLTRLFENAVSINALAARDGATRSPALGEKTQLGVSPHSLAMETLLRFLGTDFLPRLREVMDEDERVVQITSIIGSAIISPVAKQRARAGLTSEADFLAMLEATTHIHQATKIWKPYVQEAFSDAGLFDLSKGIVRTLWIKLFAAMLAGEKDKLLDLFERSLVVTSAANLFINRDHETQQRAATIRRISLCLFVCEKNHYLIQLPNIQARLVDLSRNFSMNPVVLSEIHLCLRVVMCRFGPQHLTGILPVVLSELIRVFDEILDAIPTNIAPDLKTSLAACKLLDFMLTLGMEEFQMHLWLFVKDTTDALYPDTEASRMETMTDSLSEAIAARYQTHTTTPATALVTSPPDISGRRPVLAEFVSIDSMARLQHFLIGASSRAYEGMYQAKTVDWEYLENALEEELFRKQE